MNEWRLKDKKYQEKTLGGVYFYSSPDWFSEDIDRCFYKYLPNYMKKAVLYLEVSKTPDGNHYSIYFVDNKGYVDYLDDYGRDDFLYQVRSVKDEVGDMNHYKKRWNKVGDKLEEK